MLQKNPFFLFPISHFGSAQELDEELAEQQSQNEWPLFSDFILDLEKSDQFPEKIGAFIHWSEFSFDAISPDFSEEEFDSGI